MQKEFQKKPSLEKMRKDWFLINSRKEAGQIIETSYCLVLYGEMLGF